MHIYLDESGDTGFKFGEGSSGYFVVALVLVPDVAAAEEAVRGLRGAERAGSSICCSAVRSDRAGWRCAP